MTATYQQDAELHPGDPRHAARIADRLTRRDVTPGDMAALRRLNEKRPTTAIFWKVCNELGIESAPWDLLESWAAVFRMIAIGTKVGETQTTGPHDGNVPLGRALALSGYSQNRMKTLLDADPAVLPAIVERMASYLNAKNQKFNWNDGARIMLTGRRTFEQRDLDRTRLARDFYRQLRQQERQ
ncbi:MAG: hypothetical protein OXE17_08315 [Chloroflexi bacterium]|nr:hypothetical protein [Chloroflexota bacterium]